MKFFLVAILFCFSSFLLSQEITIRGIEDQFLILQNLEKVNPSPSYPLELHSLVDSPSRKEKTSVMVRQFSPQIIKPPTAFFCRIEDAIARSSKVNMKFRLGSVQYVDALEGKGYFEALSYSRATNFQMSRQKRD